MVDTDTDDDDATSKLGSKRKFNFASYAAGAVVLDKSPNSAQGFSNLLDDDMDRYGISPCNEKKWVVIGLSEDILVSSIVIANYEKYSSTLKDFQLLASTSYPANEWINLGQYQASPALGEQTFEIPTTTFTPHTRYLKFRFLTHYGNEDLCTLSQIKVHGTTVIASFQQEVKRSDDIVKNMLSQLKTDDSTTYPSLPVTLNDSAVASQAFSDNLTPGPDSVVESEFTLNYHNHPPDSIAAVYNNDLNDNSAHEEDPAAELSNSFEPLEVALMDLTSSTQSQLQIQSAQPSPVPQENSTLSPIIIPDEMPLISRPSGQSESIVSMEPSGEPITTSIIEKASTAKQPQLVLHNNIYPIPQAESVQTDVNPALSLDFTDASICIPEANAFEPTISEHDSADPSVVSNLGDINIATVQKPVAQLTVTVTVSTNDSSSKEVISSNNNLTTSSPSITLSSAIAVEQHTSNSVAIQQHTLPSVENFIADENIESSSDKTSSTNQSLILEEVTPYVVNSNLTSDDPFGQEALASPNISADVIQSCSERIESATACTTNSTQNDIDLLQSSEELNELGINSTLLSVINSMTDESVHRITVNEVLNTSVSSTSFENIESVDPQQIETTGGVVSNVSFPNQVRPVADSFVTNSSTIPSNVTSLALQQNSTAVGTRNNVTVAADLCVSISTLNTNNTATTTSFANTTSSNTTSNGGSTSGANCASSSCSTFNTVGGSKQLSSSCLDSLKFLEFKSKMEAKFTIPIREAGTDSSQENVFTQLMQKIKHLEMSHAIYELYAVQMSECHHAVLTELWNNRKVTISSERLENIEQLLTTLQTQQEYIDQLKLALELSSPFPTNSASLPIFDHSETEPDLQTTLMERLVSLSSMPSSASMATRPSIPSTSSAITAYPGRGLKNFADCRIFSSNSLALRDCYENVYVNIHVDINSSLSLALQLQLEGLDIKVPSGSHRSSQQPSSHSTPDAIDTTIKVPIIATVGNYHVNDTSSAISAGVVGPIREESTASSRCSRRKPRPKEEYIDHRGTAGTGFVKADAILGWLKPDWIPVLKLHEQDVILLAIGSAAVSLLTLLTLLTVVVVTICRQSRSHRLECTSHGIGNKQELH